MLVRGSIKKEKQQNALHYKSNSLSNQSFEVVSLTALKQESDMTSN